MILIRGKLKKFFSSVRPLYLLISLYAVLALAASYQAYVLKVKTAAGEISHITKYNNYVIFKYSHLHLLEGKNLYSEYPGDYWDLYKYSPTFALFFGCMAWLPDWLGLSLWNLLNVLVFSLAIRLLPGLDEKKKLWILLLAAADAITSLQNSQSNLLVAGLLILGFGLFERNRYILATLCLVATFYIKIFGIAALILLLFYPEKRKIIPWAAFWMIVLWIIPAAVVGFRPLLASYLQYFDMLRNDQSVSLGFSAMGWLKAWFGLDVPKTLFAMAGFAIICLPLLNTRRFREYSNRRLFFSALLVWMVIFNHKAESPTFIIATSGIFLWFFSSKISPVNQVLLCLVVVFCSFSSTDLFPPSFRYNFFEPYVIKVVPCILVWMKMVADMYYGLRPGNRLAS